MSPRVGKAGSIGLRTWFSLAASCLLMSRVASAQTSALSLHFAPAATNIAFTIGDSLHTIHGAFRLKRGDVHLPATGGARPHLPAVTRCAAVRPDPPGSARSDTMDP